MHSITILVALLVATTLYGADLKPISSAELCGRCHRSILEAWKRSPHSQAMESALFQDVLEIAEADFGTSARKVCLSCHSPIALHLADLTLQQKVSWEGVTCDYCHSIREVRLQATNPRAVLEYGLLKSGPLKEVSSMAHGTIFSAIHASSKICAPCHEYRNALGFAVLTTYSEWEGSSYAKQGKTCQSCHMYQVAGEVVDPRVKRSRQALVNLHEMPGSHSLRMLTSTLKAQLFTKREGNQLLVFVEVANQGAGHRVPTGSPLRQMVLEVQVDSYDGKHWGEERIYQRIIVNERGETIRREHIAFMKGAKVFSDTRLAPHETRLEKFSLPLPQGVRAQVKASFSFYYSPMARPESQNRVTFLTITKLVSEETAG